MENEKSAFNRSSNSTLTKQSRINSKRSQLRSLTHRMTPRTMNRSEEIRYEQKSINPEDSSTARVNTRLFNARKQFSKTSVPTISFDDQSSPTTSPQSSRSTYSRNVMHKTDSVDSRTSMPVSPSESSYSPNFEKNLAHVTTTMRALSTSPRKGSPNALIPPYNRTLHPLTFSYDSISPEYTVDNKSSTVSPTTKTTTSDKLSSEGYTTCKTNHKGSLSPKPYLVRSGNVIGRDFMPSTLPSISPTTTTTMEDNTLLSLVHQRSTESHDSSISMPSVTSSGGSPYTSGGSQLLRSNKKEDKLYRSAEVNFSMDEQGMKQPEQHIVRRSSYEMATGKIEIPIKNSKKKSWKEALCSLKAKKDLLFKKRMKQTDENLEFGDPVYHLLRCAASPGHQPSTCKCICHLEIGEECPKVISEMTKPIKVICAPAARRKSQHLTSSKYSSSNTQATQQFNFPNVNEQNTQSKVKSSVVVALEKNRTTSSNSQLFHQTQR
uniref:Uncharacterized protein n=1 Tax=Trichobilharzia regenti TaxID=157069 RepID=A0AA85JV94_TRIRE|nr:unnamed protein product [Trichobilharzia regenti]